MRKRPYVTDSLGHRWYYTGTRIKCENDDSGPDGGYFCESFQRGIWLLAAYGYIDDPCKVRIERGVLDLKKARA